MIIDLCYRQGLAVEEIAAILKTSVNAVYTQKSRVLDKIREILRKSGSL
jgi:DNA-directed RNA polymerase specialized sigma24 family protein